VACVLLFLLKVGDSCAANRYQPLPPATVTKRGLVAYLLARVGVLPVFLAKRKSAGLKSLPLRHYSGTLAGWDLEFGFHLAVRAGL
jgi:hypothetical protein